MATGEGIMTKGKELVHADVYDMKYYFVAAHKIDN